MSKWAPLVHGRTAFVDFRPNFIVSPEGFTENDREWARRYVLAATATANFRSRPLWCLFSNDSYGVAGVVCAASDVSVDKNREEEDGRPLYVFLGYVARLAWLGLPPMDLRVFAPLYEFVRERWYEKSYDPQGLHTAPFDLRPRLIEATGQEQYDLKGGPGRVGLSPLSAGERLWCSAAYASSGPVSLCLGLTRGLDALKTPFANATAEDVAAPRVEGRTAAPQTRPNSTTSPVIKQSVLKPTSSKSPEHMALRVLESEDRRRGKSKALRELPSGDKPAPLSPLPAESEPLLIHSKRWREARPRRKTALANTHNLGLSDWEQIGEKPPATVEKELIPDERRREEALTSVLPLQDSEPSPTTSQKREADTPTMTPDISTESPVSSLFVLIGWLLAAFGFLFRGRSNSNSRRAERQRAKSRSTERPRGPRQND